MKKPSPPQGVRIWPRMLFYTFCFLAMIACREQLSPGEKPLTHSLGRALNHIMLASSKLGLGFALIGSEASENDSMVGRSSRNLGRASQQAFIESTKVRLYGN